MRLTFLLLTTILLSVPAAAQVNDVSSSQTDDSSGEYAPPEELPVSVDRIREALAKALPKPLLGKVEVRPDYSVTVEQRFAIEDSFRPEDFKAGPVPAGGLYAYEQQQLLWNKVSDPLAQPYAAFSGGELLTIALENLLIKYLGGRLVQAMTTAERAQAEEAARANAARAIAEYCAAQPGGGAGIEICTPAEGRGGDSPGDGKP
jgi:hypothetical protein